MSAPAQEMDTVPARERLVKGVLYGLAAALMWAIYNIGVEIGRADGFTSADLAILRYAVAAALLAPFLFLRWSRLPPGLTLRRVVLLSLTIGPPFAFLFNTGYGIAPLAHAVVISPGVTMLVANLLPVLLDGQRLPMHRKIGIAVLVLGLIAIAADRPPAKTPGEWVLLGDLCFVGSGTLWGVFTYLLGRWRLPAVETTAAMSLMTTAGFLPLYLAFFTPADLPLSAWAEQALYQGALGGCLAIVAFAASITWLGSGLAGLFPALVPPLAVLLAIPIAGQWPNGLQLVGVLIATTGLVLSLDALSRLFRRLRYGPDRGTGPR
ncbi:DMT family transporter [Nitratireductor pacificus]|uniref:DMT family permease n=1 Tax=Nitratireductor pacificus pht-3B TaxID=391937 RepID=K2M9P3_9HYPH|nr:DMT family transporter [Nitratireductor pacificus]EKF18861.1 DMT family permease [Nitratireductor pacificus pht-3B]